MKPNFRWKKILAIGSMLFLLGMAGMLQSCKSNDSKASEAASTSIVAEFLPTVAPLDSLVKKVRMGESLQRIVQNFDVNTDDANTLMLRIQECFKEKIYPGQQYLGVFSKSDNDIRIEEFQIESSDATVLWSWVKQESKAAQNECTWDFKTDSLPTFRDTSMVKTTLQSSLYESVMASGESPALVQELIRLFAWDIDFFKDPRHGDEIQVLVEKRYDYKQRFQGYGKILAANYKNQGRDFWGIDFKDNYYGLEGKSLEKMLLKAPLNYTRVSSGFSLARLHPVLGKYRPHWGIDYAAPTGTPVFAAGDGRVDYLKWVNGYGNTVKIKHNGTYTTYYAHLSRFAKGVKPGSYVKQGQVVAYVGMTGLASGPHLDYRIEESGRFINPANLKTQAKEGLNANDMQAFIQIRDRFLKSLDGIATGTIAGKTIPDHSEES